MLRLTRRVLETRLDKLVRQCSTLPVRGLRVKFPLAYSALHSSCLSSAFKSALGLLDALAHISPKTASMRTINNFRLLQIKQQLLLPYSLIRECFFPSQLKEFSPLHAINGQQNMIIPFNLRLHHPLAIQ